MSARQPTDVEITRALQAWLPERAADGLRDRVFDAVVTTTQERPMPSVLGALTLPDPVARRGGMLVAAVLLLGLLLASAAAIGALRLLERQTEPPALVAPVPTPTATAGATPTKSPSATPSATPEPLPWSEASRQQDWPASVRVEPDGGPTLLPVVPEDGEHRYPDPTGDTGSDAYPWVDIREVRAVTYGLTITLDSNLPRNGDSTQPWIAYGLVLDDDGDGVPDRRIGMDAAPFGPTGGQYRGRGWITDLHTGRTVVPTIDSVDGHRFEWRLPGATFAPPDGAMFLFGGGDLAGGGTAGGMKLDMPLYAWASVIKDGRVVATDYAPDAGWLSLQYGPQVEASPSPSPGPGPRVEDDPDLPGGRLWTVRVVNGSPRPATLLVAEETEAGLAGRAVGTATPSVVPAGATLEVIFAIPPAGSRGWAIFVTTGPNTGGGLGWFDAPTAGEFRIGRDGSVGWLSP